MSHYLLERETLIASDIQTVWDFFTMPENLFKITPAHMNFRMIHTSTGQQIYSGMQIKYEVSPLLKIPMTWVTLIKEVTPFHHFIDVQKQGPYKVWEHTHTFETVSGGVLMKDSVQYEMPFGFLGRLVHALFVKKQLEVLFDYRTKQIKILFP